MLFIGNGKYNTMPRLSLYRPQKGNDYKFIDKTVWEMFQVGGTDMLVHKYLGPGDPVAGESSPTKPIYTGTNPFQIQDLLFLENRDRKYDPDVYVLRGVYNLQDIDFNLSQFGLFLQNDTIFVTFHINDTVEKLGRKIIAGDVIELPHLKDEYALNDLTFALKRFYVVEEVNRAAEGFSVTWYPHLYRAKCKPLVDSQEFKQILDNIADTDNFQGVWDPEVTYYPGDVVTGPDNQKYTVIAEVTGVAPPNTTYYKSADTLRDIMSTYEKEMQITQAVLDQAEADAPKSGYDTTAYYTLKVTDQGSTELVTVNAEDIPSSASRQATDTNGNLLFNEAGDPIYIEPNASSVNQTVDFDGYPGYLVGDGLPANGAPFTSGIAFPMAPIKGQFCLRTDYMPRRLFRFDGARWVKIEDDVRMTMSNNDTRNTYKTGFINNTKKTNFDKLVTDVFTFGNSPRAPITSAIITAENELYVVTNVPYQTTYGVEAFLNDVAITTVIDTTQSVVSFTVKSKVFVGDKLSWTIYRDSVEQRQSLSKALRPKADM